MSLVEDPDDFEEHDQGDADEDLVGVGRDVRMPELVNLHEAQDGDQVHEGRVELEWIRLVFKNLELRIKGRLPNLKTLLQKF